MSQTPITPIRITHIGGPTVLIEIGQLRLLTDPTFEPAGYQYVAGPQIIRKAASPALQGFPILPEEVKKKRFPSRIQRIQNPQGNLVWTIQH
jgi:L-ascorbate metabolism protein UlaG (beta-lactamase superfamily)